MHENFQRFCTCLCRCSISVRSFINIQFVWGLYKKDKHKNKNVLVFCCSWADFFTFWVAYNISYYFLKYYKYIENIHMCSHKRFQFLNPWNTFFEYKIMGSMEWRLRRDAQQSPDWAGQHVLICELIVKTWFSKNADNILNIWMFFERVK